MESLLAMLTIFMLSTCGVSGRDWMANYMDGMMEQISQHGLQEFQEKAWVPEGHHPALSCPDTSPSPQTPTRADRVRPADVKVVAALGDSVTTAIGANATNILQIPTEYRQLSWSIGGQAGAVTLPNILKVFNPNLVGFSKRSTVSYKPPLLEDTGLNLAVTGTNSYEFLEQTRRLISTIKTYPGINYEEDWKLITVFIGANDLCDYCKNKTLFSAESFILNVSQALDLLRDELPRSIINVVQLMRIEMFRRINNRTIGCLLLRTFCSCVVQPKENSSELLELLEQRRLFQEKLEDLVERSGRYDGKGDFAVVLQPFMEEMQPASYEDGTIDFTYMAPDCFHLTIKGHQQLAKGLWNNMLQPPGKKTRVTSFSENIQLACPSEEHPYIYTRQQLLEEEEEEKDEGEISGALRELPQLHAVCLLLTILTLYHL